MIRIHVALREAFSRLTRRVPGAVVCSFAAAWAAVTAAGFVFCMSAPASAQDTVRKTVVLIFPVKLSGVNFSDTQRAQIREYLDVRLTKEGVYKTMPEAQVKKDLGDAKLESYMDCYDEVCRKDLTKTVFADKSISVEITTESKGCRVTAKLYDIVQEATETAADVSTRCDFDSVKASMVETARQLSGKGGEFVGETTAGVTDSGIVSGGITVELGEKIVNRFTDEKGFLTVRTHRKGDSKEAHAMILINGKEFRPADFIVEQMVGEYVIAARLDEFHHVATKRINLDVKGATVDLELLPAFGELTVTSSPGDAEVIVNDKPAGKTSAAGIWTDKKVKSGRYAVEVRKSLYKSEKKFVTVSDGQSTAESFELDADWGNVELTSEPSGAQVFLDGKDVGVTGTNPLKFNNLTEGRHVIRLVRDFYVAEERKIDVGDGRTVREHVVLKTDFGGLKLDSNPSGAQVTIDDKSYGKQTPITVTPLKPGVHFVSFEKEGYGKAVEKVVVENGKTAALNVNLQPKQGILSVLSEKEDGTPCDGEVTIDGKSVGRTPWKSEVLAVKHKVEVTCAEGANSTTVTVPHNGRESLTLKVGNRGNVAVTSFYENGTECSGRVRMNGSEKGMTPYDEWVSSGTYEIRVDCEDGVGEADVRIGRGERKFVKVEVAGRPVYAKTPWIMAGLGVATIVGGGVLTYFADHERQIVADSGFGSTGGLVNGMTHSEALDRLNRADNEDKASIAMYTVGSAAVLTGLIWGLVDVAKVNATRERTKSRARVSGIVLPGGGGIGIAGAF